MNRTTMTEAERLELADKLDKDLEEFMRNLPKRQPTDPMPLDELTEELKSHPFFMKELPKEGDELHPLYEGLQQLKYDPAENTAEELANSYKEDGNFNFKHKKYRLAILTYTEGIKTNCKNDDVIATLHNNRSAANYYLKNYRSALNDCRIALKHKPNYDKATIRAANCCIQISKYDECIEYCDKILTTDPENIESLTLRQKAVNSKKNHERDLRRTELRKKNEQLEEERLLNILLDRGFQLDVDKNSLKLQHLEPHFPELMNSRVFLDANNQLIWPVALLYPEHKTMDFIRSFPENDRLIDHLSAVFEDTPAWDSDRAYNVNSISVYFENKKIAKLFPVDVSLSLTEILRNEKFVVSGGTPSFLVFVRGSKAERHFTKSYS